MKIRRFILILLIFSSTHSFGQDIFWGLKGGASVTRLQNTPGEIEGKTSFSAAASALIVMEDTSLFSRFAFMNEISYLPVRYATPETRANINYLSYSFRPRMYFGVFGELISGFYVEAGPYASVMLNGFEKDIQDYSVRNLEPLLNRFDAGLVFSGGIALFSVLSLEYNYNLGLLPLFKETDVQKGMHTVSLRFALPL